MRENIIKENIIRSTALDYDMSYGEVELIYDQWHDEGKFYEKLEEFIENRKYFRNRK